MIEIAFECTSAFKLGIASHLLYICLNEIIVLEFSEIRMGWDLRVIGISLIPKPDSLYLPLSLFSRLSTRRLNSMSDRPARNYLCQSDKATPWIRFRRQMMVLQQSYRIVQKLTYVELATLLPMPATDTQIQTLLLKQAALRTFILVDCVVEDFALCHRRIL